MKITINFAYPGGQVNLGDNIINNFRLGHVNVVGFGGEFSV